MKDLRTSQSLMGPLRPKREKSWPARRRRKQDIAADIFLEHEACRLKGMHDGQRGSIGHDAAVRVAAAVAKDHHIAGKRPQACRRMHFFRPVEDEAEIAFLGAVQIPIIGIWARIERSTEPGIDEDANEQHPAIDAGALDVALRVIWGPDPGARFPHDNAARVLLKVRRGHRVSGQAPPDARYILALSPLATHGKTSRR